MTGAALPAGADAVVMVEDTSAERDRTGGGRRRHRRGARRRRTRGRHPANRQRRQHRRCRGRRGTVLRPAHLGVLASVGVRTVRAYPRLRVGLLVTGDELVTSDRRLEPGEIYESNGALLTACIEQAGCRAGRPRGRRRRRRRPGQTAARRGGDLRCDRDDRRRVDGRRRPGQGCPVPARAAALDAGADPAGQTVRLRRSRRPVRRRAGLRSARESGVVPGQLRVARPSSAALDDRPLVVAPAAHPGHCGRTAARARRQGGPRTCG